jgi:hypothetical protein
MGGERANSGSAFGTGTEERSMAERSLVLWFWSACDV